MTSCFVCDSSRLWRNEFSYLAIANEYSRLRGSVPPQTEHADVATPPYEMQSNKTILH